jgi:hypothetical protein
MEFCYKGIWTENECGEHSDREDFMELRHAYAYVTCSISDGSDKTVRICGTKIKIQIHKGQNNS